jgi:coenzyme F420 hydrogenase subunit beta
MGKEVKSFVDLTKEVQMKGLCHRCGGCVTFCQAINYGALELGENGLPHFRDPEKCIECGLCYMLCPEIDELVPETKKLVAWEAPMGSVLKVSSARSSDTEVSKRATDGGVVTTLLLCLFDAGRIDGAIVSKHVGGFRRVPWLATSREEILEAAGTHFDESHGLERFAEKYATTFSGSIHAFRLTMEKGLNRVAVVGTPCQIHTIRKMEALRITPADTIEYKLGLFCNRNFIFDGKMISQLERLGGFQFKDVAKINIKKDFLLTLRDGTQVAIPLDKMNAMIRPACRFCSDYSAEYADISFGGLGSPHGWTSFIVRTPVGQKLYYDALRDGRIEEHPEGVDLEMITEASSKKKASAAKFRKNLNK